MSNNIAVGTPYFSRRNALAQLVASLPPYVSTVYVADNGEGEPVEVLDGPLSADVTVLDLPYDAGIGACRAAITDAVTEPYLFMCDSDMQITRHDDLRVLRRIVSANNGLGGVAGWLREDEIVRSGARDLQRVGDTIIKEARGERTMAEIPYPHARFDFIPQAALFDTDVFATYEYDADAGSSEHVDFFLGHQAADKWTFASTPTVLIDHNRWVDREYRTSERGGGHVDLNYVAEKWGVENIVPGAHADWAQLRDRSVPEQAFSVFRAATPPQIWLPVRRALRRVTR